MYKLLILLVMHLFIVNGEENKILFNQRDAEADQFNHISKCIKSVSDLALKSRPTVVIDTRNIQNKSKEDMFIKEVANKLEENNTPIVILADEANTKMLHDISVIEDEVYNKTYSLGGLIVTYFETCDDLSSYVFSEINKEAKHLTVISKPSNDSCIHKLQEIKDIVGKYDATFLLNDINENRNQIFTFIPIFDVVTCQEIIDKPTHINTCVNGNLETKDVFPSKKPTNLNKCPFRVGMATLYPFSQIGGQESLKLYDPINSTVGSDMPLMNIFTKCFNATLELHYIYRKEENPYGEKIFLKYLLNGSLDVCAGGLYRIYGDVVAYSGIYARQAVVWIYYAERVERSWQHLIEKVNGLYIFVIFYLVYSIIWYFVCIFDGDAVSLRLTLLYGWGALLGATSLQDARSMKQKILNLVYLILNIYLSAYISTILYSYLTIRAPPQIFNSNEDVMQSGRVPYLKSSTKYFIDDKSYRNFANTSSECVSFMDCAEKTFENNGLTVVLQADFFNFQSATAVAGEARILRATENLLTVYNEMLIRKDSPLVTKFHQVTQSLFEAGITERLYKEAIGILVIAKARSANSNMMMNSYSCQAGCSITFMQFAGVFYVWIFGCTLSCVVFVIEICMKRETKSILAN